MKKYMQRKVWKGHMCLLPFLWSWVSHSPNTWMSLHLSSWTSTCWAVQFSEPCFWVLWKFHCLSMCWKWNREAHQGLWQLFIIPSSVFQGWILWNEDLFIIPSSVVQGWIFWNEDLLFLLKIDFFTQYILIIVPLLHLPALPLFPYSCNCTPS